MHPPVCYRDCDIMRTQSLTLSLALLLTPVFAQSPAPQSAQPAAPPAAGQPAATRPPNDHQHMMDLLGITALRPGVAQNGQGAHPVNWDESKANPWPNLPDPLIFNNGKPVKSAKDWTTKRRPELVELFDNDIVGRVPANVPAVHWEVVSSTPGSEGGIPTITKRLMGHVDNSAYPAITVDIEVDLILPAAAIKPIPAVVELTFDRPIGSAPPPPRPARPAPPAAAATAAGSPAPARSLLAGSSAAPYGPSPKQQALAKGWAFALLYPTTYQADGSGGLTSGIIGLVNHGQPRKLDDWGALRAWAWGASRLVDYFQTDPAIDAHHLAVEGHSRFGKAALVTMAYEPRYTVAYINSSGAGGASLARRRFGEQYENIAGGEAYWMDGNYIKYAEAEPNPLTPADMPVDMHELIALCAPRPVFIGGGTLEGGDGWADVRGTYLAEFAAGPVYKLLGKKPLSDDSGPIKQFPPVGTAVIAGDLAFRQHPYGHNPQPNFATFLTWATRYMTPTK
jgi:hypothetical protein